MSRTNCFALYYQMTIRTIRMPRRQSGQTQHG
jgi:hypothetical protein